MSELIVERAIKSLSRRINLSTGLSHPMDKAAAIDILNLLKKEGFHYSSEEIKILAIRNGWTSTGANEIFRIADMILSGRKPRKCTTAFTWNPDILDILKSEET